ncbi:DUF3298 and DUF4163 domain-containing protein [Sediminibacillus albus]|uniref:DUF3298 domain-containing protein n=1 Tax=Sediminibacillus albus TaxID=407036 RepID=A0A1G8WHG6_9BACI|nr:DUF3298 and DUF4163 domain-containing protein [Sediminibacillus albus]SDJ76970.1 Protein of unknown function [Sediminibacillus albus]
MKCLALLFFFGAISLPINSQQPLALSIKSVEEPAHPGSIIIGTKPVKEKTDFVKIDLEIPVINGLAERKFEKKLNNRIKKQAMKAKTAIITAAKQAEKEAEIQDRKFRPYELNIDYSVKNTEQLLSFTVSTYTFTGGAHGTTATEYYNIDIAESKNITLGDLFSPNSNYKQTISENIKQQIRGQEAAEEGVYFKPDNPFTGALAFQSISKDQLFYIEDSSIVIAFSQYEIAPGSMGEPVFKIPFTMLKEQLRNKYTPSLEGF